MKKSLLCLAIAASLPSVALAESPTVYGKINVSVVSANTVPAADQKAQTTKVNSNASRLGFKGKMDLEGGLQAIYKAEFETFVDAKKEATIEIEDDNGDVGEDNVITPFKQRNIFGGLKGDFGTIKVGYFDSLVKASQKKVDLFSDLEGDIKHVLSNSEQRKSNTVQYSTPKMAGLVANVAYLGAEQEDGEGDGVAASLTYNRDALYVAYAYGKNASKGGHRDVSRVVTQYGFSDITLGALYEQQGEESGWVASAAVKATDKIKVKAQYGQSTIKTADDNATALSLGVDYKLAKKAKLFVYATQNDYKVETKDALYVGTGVEVKF